MTTKEEIKEVLKDTKEKLGKNDGLLLKKLRRRRNEFNEENKKKKSGKEKEMQGQLLIMIESMKWKMEDLEFQVKRVKISLKASTNSTQESIDHISISRHAHKERFYDPPTSSAEKDYQKYFRQHYIPLIGTLMVHDTYLIPILDRSKLDFVGIAKDLSLDPLNVSLIIEIKPYKPNQTTFSNADVGQLAFFALKIFQIQPTRTFVYGILSDCHHIMILKTPEELEWREIEISYNNNSDYIKLLKWLGHGKTAQVFERIVSKRQHVDHRIAVKIARNSMCKKIKKEVYILMILKKIDGIPNVLYSNENSFVMKPLCYKIYSFNKLDLDRIINIIQNIHTQGIVYWNLHRHNILRDRNTGTVQVINWRYVININLSLSFASRLDCISDLVLKSMRDRREIIYQKSNDLISLLRSFYLVLHEQVDSVALPLANTNNQDYASKMLDF
ncbi:15345_t:CDS:2 [Funneliformis caledonium]|uniref:15345_t:CDS:1 n=1 Tax=Funneliformis caledonium TaxID=1117310 RepID=A0A9N9HEI2_9GLOM|nr:15345_t:CDS:2 [Funneliformis caledonium]